MAPHATPDVSERVAPVWYRRRELFFGLSYGLGFFIGNAVPLGSGEPTAVVLGRAFGDANARVWFAVAAAATVICWLIRVWGSSYLRAATVWSDVPLDDRLIVDGPFRFVRNPLYLGLFFAAIGIGSLAPPLGTAIVLLGNALLVTGLIREEERLLRSRYGAVFDAYRAAVPALIPRLKPATVPGTARTVPSLAEGLLSEPLFGSFALGMIAVAAFGSRGIVAFYAFGIVGGLATFVVQRVRSKPAT